MTHSKLPPDTEPSGTGADSSTSAAGAPRRTPTKKRAVKKSSARKTTAKQPTKKKATKKRTAKNKGA